MHDNVKRKAGNWPKVTIVIPVFNAVSFLSECIKSVIHQTYDNWEIIIIDDASTDGSKDLEEKFIKSDSRIRLIQQEHVGSGKARNLGINNAKGEYIAFLDADDYWKDEKCLEHIINTIEGKGLDVVGTFACTYNDGQFACIPLHRENGIIDKEGWWVNFKEEQCIFYHWTYLFRTGFLKENNFFYGDYLRGQDPPFLLKCLDKAEKFYVIPEECYVHRVEHKSSRLDRKQIFDLLRSIKDTVAIAKEKNYYKVIKEYITRGIDNIDACREIMNGDVEILSLYLSILTEAGVPLKGNSLCELVKHRLIDGSNAYRMHIENELHNRNVIIFGAGYYGQKTYEALCIDKQVRIDRFVTSQEPSRTEVCGIRVNRISDSNTDRTNVLLLIAAQNYQDMLVTAEDLGFEHIIVIDYQFQAEFWK